MNKDNLNNEWYQLWLQQSDEFFKTADKNLKRFFEKGSSFNPEDHLNEIKEWLNKLKSQWELTQLNETIREQQTVYWNMMTRLYNDASEQLINQWIKRAHDKKPIQNSQELFELWLQCWREACTAYMHSKTYQEAYGELMKAALKFWESVQHK